MSIFFVAYGLRYSLEISTETEVIDHADYEYDISIDWEFLQNPSIVICIYFPQMSNKNIYTNEQISWHKHLILSACKSIIDWLIFFANDIWYSNLLEINKIQRYYFRDNLSRKIFVEKIEFWKKNFIALKKFSNQKRFVFFFSFFFSYYVFVIDSGILFFSLYLFIIRSLGRRLIRR